MSSLYSQYIKEREGLDTLETEDGFLTYKYLEDGVFIQDIYVVPEKRRDKVSSKLADRVVEEAVQKGYKTLYGQIDTKANGWEISIKVLEGYGMTPFKVVDTLVLFKKDIG